MIALRALLVAGSAAALAVCIPAFAQRPMIPRVPAPPAEAPPPKVWLEGLQSWVAAADAHAPGAFDAHLLSIASLGEADLHGILTDLVAVRDRRVLDLVKPRASEDQEVRTWYVATGRLMRRQYTFAHSIPHLARAREVFADDASIQFLSGCLHGALASDRVQSFSRDWRHSPETPSRERELARAESFLARAVEIAPTLAEARADVVAYGVSVGTLTTEPFLNDLVDATGGTLHQVESTRNLGGAFLRVLNEFRQRYLLGCTPQGVSNDGWHRLDVRVKRPRVAIEARPGYLAGSRGHGGIMK